MIVDQNHYSIFDENHTYPSSKILQLARQYQQLSPAHAKVIGLQIDNAILDEYVLTITTCLAQSITKVDVFSC